MKSEPSGAILLLAGTGEARTLADTLANTGTDCTVRVPGEGRDARDWPLPTICAPLADCLDDPAIAAVLDASHPFASDISHHAARHCAARNLPYCLLRRPAWRAQPGDRWTHAPSEADAVRRIAPGSTVFLATGREGLAHFAALKDSYIYCRQIGTPEAPFPWTNGEYLIQQPPFAVADEIALFQRLRIDWLVLRNAGSARAETKLTAARHLGLNVMMIDRPAPPDAPQVATVAEALAWVATL